MDEQPKTHQLQATMIAVAASSKGPKLYVMTQTGHVLTTTDDGESWNIIELPNTITIHPPEPEPEPEAPQILAPGYN